MDRSTSPGAHARPKPAHAAPWRRRRPGTLPAARHRGLATRAVPLMLVGGLAGGLAAPPATAPLATATGARPAAHATLTAALQAAGPAAVTPGSVEGFGSAPSLGGPGPSGGGRPVALTPTASDQGYWVAASDGGVFAYGDAAFHGSMGGAHLNSPVVGIAATPDGGGYWLVAADGGIFAFGDAAFLGSMGGQRLQSPIVGLAPAAGGQGYWMAAADGGVFSFGGAGFHGSLPSIGQPASTVTAIAATPTGAGYWLVEGSGAVYAFGDATYAGAPPVEPPSTEVVGVAAAHQGAGYWEATSTPAPAAPAVTGTDLGPFVVTCYDDHGTTASGAQTNAATVSVDPSVIPMGSTISIAGVGVRVAQDTGSAIKGKRLDIWEPTAAQCSAWGVQTRDVSLQSR